MKRILYIALMCITSLAWGQSKMTVSGSVKDSAGEPVIGAVILLEGRASVGAVSDANGKYSLSFTPVAGNSLVLLFHV